jgi:hypothetical protein
MEVNVIVQVTVTPIADADIVLQYRSLLWEKTKRRTIDKKGSGKFERYRGPAFLDDLDFFVTLKSDVDATEVDVEWKWFTKCTARG